MAGNRRQTQARIPWNDSEEGNSGFRNSCLVRESILKKIRKQEDGHFPAVWQSLPGILRMFDVDSNLKGCYTYG